MIDDSGTGDLLGDAFIAFWRRETNDLLIKAIPLEIFQSPDFNEKSKSHVKDLLINAITELNIPLTEEIYMCSGPIFDECRNYLSENGFNYFTAKIEGYFQEVVEQAYVDHLVNDVGIPNNFVTVESGKQRFMALFHWVCQDYPRRNRFVKSGFDKWQTKWSQTAQEDWMRFVVNLEPLPSDSNLLEEFGDDVLTDESSIIAPVGPKKKSSRPYHAGKRTGFKKSKPAAKPQQEIKKTQPQKASTGSEPSAQGKPRKYSKQTQKRGSPSRSSSKDASTDHHYSSTNHDPRRKLF